jgi:uncharacterized repeat protein (TIGR03803 family)
MKIRMFVARLLYSLLILVLLTHSSPSRANSITPHFLSFGSGVARHYSNVSGKTPTVLFSFTCQRQSCPQGTEPEALIQASDGNFYGAAFGGGSSSAGTIFKLTPNGVFTLLFDFNGSNGAEPGFSLVEARDGTLWGSTFLGGQFGKGEIFKMNKDGSGFTVVHSFPSSDAEFFFKVTLISGKDGNIYGSSPGGGNHLCGGYGCGTIFRINLKTGRFVTLHVLDGKNDGANPSGMVQASDGNFYGVATGNQSSSLFRFTPIGKYGVVITFPSGDYAYSNGSVAGGGGVIQASTGSLFGLLYGAQGKPHLYETALDGKGFHVFPPISALQFSVELSTLLQTTDGTLWLTSYGVSQGDNGSIVQLSPQDGSLIQNIRFNGIDGSRPAAALIQGVDGKLFGTTLFDNVFSL